MRAFQLLVLILTGVTCFSANSKDLSSRTHDSDNAGLLEFIDRYSKQKLEKDEFETTVSYQKRLSEFRDKEFIISVPARLEGSSSDGKPLEYDADTQILRIHFVGHESIDSAAIVKSAGLVAPPPTLEQSLHQATLRGPTNYDYDLAYPKFYVRKTTPRFNNEYVGSNAFGVKAQVRVFSSKERSVAFANISYERFHGVPLDLDGMPIERRISMSAENAKAVISKAHWRLYLRAAIIPDQRSFIFDESRRKPPTIDDPSVINWDSKTLIAKLAKAELYDPRSGKVIASFDFEEQMRQQEQVKAYYASIVQGCSGYAELKIRSACNAKASDCFRQNGSNVKKFTQCIIPGGQEELSRTIQATQKEIADKLNGRGKIGININNRVVVTVVSGGGAEKAGVTVGDIIVSADDQELTGNYVDDVMRITGEPNSVARLKIMRGTKELLLDVQRSGAD